MTKINPFLDKRPIPKVNINVKIKVKTNSAKENADWNKAFGYLMKKPRTKLEFLTVNVIRKLQLEKITLNAIKPLILQSDYEVLATIEDIFNTRLTSDIKSFILAVLRIPIKDLDDIINSQAA
jgi:hypothetical protein